MKQNPERGERGGGIGRDREEVEEELVVEESKVLRRGLWRVRREAMVGREKPSLETSHRSGVFDESWLLMARLSRAQCPEG